MESSKHSVHPPERVSLGMTRAGFVEAICFDEAVGRWRPLTRQELEADAAWSHPNFVIEEGPDGPCMTALLAQSDAQSRWPTARL